MDHAPTLPSLSAALLLVAIALLALSGCQALRDATNRPGLPSRAAPPKEPGSEDLIASSPRPRQPRPAPSGSHAPAGRASPRPRSGPRAPSWPAGPRWARTPPIRWTYPSGRACPCPPSACPASAVRRRRRPCRRSPSRWPTPAPTSRAPGTGRRPSAAKPAERHPPRGAWSARPTGTWPCGGRTLRAASRWRPIQRPPGPSRERPACLTMATMAGCPGAPRGPRAYV
jgi:hypothetical protein